jgi:hypothetical protein
MTVKRKNADLITTLGEHGHNCNGKRRLRKNLRRHSHSEHVTAPDLSSTTTFFYGGNICLAGHTRRLADQQLSQQNQLLSQSDQEGTQDRSLLLPTISKPA